MASCREQGVLSAGRLTIVTGHPVASSLDAPEIVALA